MNLPRRKTKARGLEELHHMTLVGSTGETTEKVARERGAELKVPSLYAPLRAKVHREVFHD